MKLNRRDAFKALGAVTPSTAWGWRGGEGQGAEGADPRWHRFHRSALRGRADRRRPQDHAVQSRQARSGSQARRRAVVRRPQRPDRGAGGPRLGRRHRQLGLHAQAGEAPPRICSRITSSNTSSSRASPCTRTSRAEIDEDYNSRELKGTDLDTVNGESTALSRCWPRRWSRRLTARRATIIRPTYIAGPGDVTDRFTYWPFRVSKGGEMLAPGTPADPFQFIDVRDLADFIRALHRETRRRQLQPLQSAAHHHDGRAARDSARRSRARIRSSRGRARSSSPRTRSSARRPRATSCPSGNRPRETRPGCCW